MFSNRDLIEIGGLQIAPRAFNASSGGVSLTLRKAAQKAGVPPVGWTKASALIAAFKEKFLALPDAVAFARQRERLSEAAENLQKAVDDRDEFHFQLGDTLNNDEEIKPEAFEQADRRAATLRLQMNSLMTNGDERRRELRELFNQESSAFLHGRDGSDEEPGEIRALQKRADTILRDLMTQNAAAFNELVEIGDVLHGLMRQGAMPTFDQVVAPIARIDPPHSFAAPVQQPARIDAGARAAFPAIMG